LQSSYNALEKTVTMRYKATWKKSWITGSARWKRKSISARTNVKCAQRLQELEDLIAAKEASMKTERNLIESVEQFWRKRIDRSAKKRKSICVYGEQTAV
jgi:hypothetical protein